MPEKILWHSLNVNEVLKSINSGSSGLSSAEAEVRIKEYGLNALTEKKGISPLQIFIDQFKNALVLMLIFAAVISIFVGEFVDGALILAIVFMNGVFGFIQEYKAEKNIEELKKLSKPRTTVLRDGVEKVVPSETLVPGDVIVLEEGDSVTADARVIEQFSLRVDESSLTGESVPVSKRDVELKSV
ncbi:MAG: HAD-IC family P-type ATPase, partial [Candidatus Altiarchaeota archaeon]|nr:HAD-IC family P-type ATPase [Candidatus Altiarchaeota archaeon]